MAESKTMTFSTRVAMLMAIFMLAFLAGPMSCADKIDAKIDIVLVIADDNNFDQTYQIQACKKLMAYFETGEGKVRFALSTLLRWNKGWTEGPMPHAQIFILMNFSGDPKVHSKVLENVTMPWRHDPGKEQTWSWSETIHHVSDYVITNSPPGRLKAVVIFLSFFTNIFYDQFGPPWAQQLRDKGAWVYVLTKVGTKMYRDDKLVLPYANNLTCNPNRTIIVGHTDKNFDASLVDAMVKVRDGILRDTCLNYGDTACAYKDKERRKCEYTTQYVSDPKQCVPFGLNVSCDPVDCRGECDRRWPWVKEPSCVGKCGVDVEGERNGTDPPAMMENCPLSMTCQRCTTTAQPSTLRPTSTASPNSTATPNSTETTNSTATLNSTATPNSTASPTSTAAASSTVVPPFIKTEAASPSNTGSSASLVGLIVGIVVPVLLILIIAVVATIVVEKRAAAKKRRLDVAKKTASFKGPMLLKKPSKTISAAAAAGKVAEVGETVRRAADAAIAADISVRSHSPAGVERGGKPRIKDASKRVDAAKSVKSEVKGPSAMQVARGKSPVKK